MLIGATGNQPSQYPQPDTPPMCFAVVCPSGSKLS